MTYSFYVVCESHNLANNMHKNVIATLPMKVDMNEDPAGNFATWDKPELMKLPLHTGEKFIHWQSTG